MADISQINLPNDNNSPYDIKDASVPHSRLTAASGGTDLSLVTTDDLDKIENAGYQYILSNSPSAIKEYVQIGWIYNNQLMMKHRAPLYRYTKLNIDTSVAASGWTSISTGWNDEIVITEFSSWSDSTNDNSNWGHLSVQWNKTNKDIRVLNIRSQAAKIDSFTMVFYITSEFLPY